MGALLDIAGEPWAVPLIVASLAFVGVLVTVFAQSRNFRRQIASAHALKVAELRAARTHELRSAMAKFQSYCAVLDGDPHRAREAYEAGTAIELLMDPADPDFAELQGALYVYLQAQTREEKIAANARFLAVCQRVLGREWEKLRAGIRGAERAS